MAQNRVLNVLVTGATGKQGGTLARALLTRGHKVRAFTRKPDSPGAQELRQRGAELAVGSFDDAGSLERAIAGTDAVFAMGTPYEAGPDVETRQGLALVDAARKVGTRHFVYTSVGGADQNTGIPHFDSKYVVEKHLATTDLPSTIIAPVFFMDNLAGPWWLPGLKNGTFAFALPAGRKLQQIAVDDIASFAAKVIDQRDPWLGKRIDLASDELTGQEAVDVLSRVSGKKISYFELPVAELRNSSEDFARMMEWFDRVGYNADIAGLRRSHPDVGWHTFEDWAKKQDWKALLG